MKPIIAVACNLEFFNERAKVSVNRTYTNALLAAGALPLIVPITADTGLMEQALDAADGLLLPGGIDIQPLLFGAQPAQNLGKTNQELDFFQEEITRFAVKRGMPVLGICRGIQILNVALGGTLIQDIQSEVRGAFQHDQKMDPCWPSHTVESVPGSIVAEIYGVRFNVNSFHHQAVAKVASCLKVTAKAPDGIIEAVESEEQPFVVGLQWHPEGLAPVCPQSQAFFRRFVSACEK